MHFKKSMRLTLALVSATYVIPSHAAITTYTDQAAFLNALNGATIFQDSFSDVGAGSPLSLTRTGNGLTVTYTAPVSGLFTIPGEISSFMNVDHLRATLGSGIFAAGGNFYMTDINGNFQPYPGLTTSANASNGIDPISTLSASTNSTSTFFGWISTTPLTVVISTSGGSSPARWNTIDNFIVATAPAPAAPGPLPLFGALGAMAWSRRLRQRVVAGRSSQVH
jgi:hypothetical protein